MCTVTIVPLLSPTSGPGVTARGSAPGVVRIACNRDESRQRPPALPPTIHAYGRRHAIHPTDPTGGGTWVAVNDAGLFFTLLNRNPQDMRGITFTGRRSRGAIIPSMLHCASLAETDTIAHGLDASHYPPFRLVMTDGRHFVELVGENDAIHRRSEPIGVRPCMFTSSGIGDELVEAPRRELFDGWFGEDAVDWPRLQDAFHRHRWEDRPELSVCMSRADALSVSLTTVVIGHEKVSLTYHGAPPDAPAGDVYLELPRTHHGESPR